MVFNLIALKQKFLHFQQDFQEKTTVRCGEFSPLNPAFRSDKTVLGLGDYEQLRKTFLEKKKQEYVQYFQNDNVSIFFFFLFVFIILKNL